MKHFADEWVNQWCEDNGWTDLVVDGKNTYWAFPPNAVMPEPIPNRELKVIKYEKGLSPQERVWAIAAVIVTISATIASVVMKCPIPIVLAFAFCAVTVGQFDLD